MKRSMMDFFRCVPWCGFISMAQSTGVSVSATIAEMMIEPAMVMENCR